MPDFAAASTSAKPTKREAVVAASVICFARDGFAGTTIAAVAQQAGIGKGTVYEYFRSKEELLLDACLWCCQHNQAQVHEVLSGAGTTVHSNGGDAAQTIHQVMVAVFSVVPSGSQAYARLFSDLWTVAAEEPHMLAQAQARLREVYAQWEGVITFLYGSGLARGVFKPLPDPAMFARLFTAIVDGLIWQQPFRPDRTQEALARSAADCLLALVTRDTQRPSELLA